MPRRRRPTRRRFGAIRQYRSGRFTASYLDNDGIQHRSPHTFATRTDASLWLDGIETSLLDGTWVDPDAPADQPPHEDARGVEETDLAPETFRAYAERWVAERQVRGGSLAATTKELYARVLRLHIFPTFADHELAELTPAAVRTWHAGLRETTGSTARAQAYRLLHAIMQTACDDDELIARNPCRLRGAGQQTAPERPVATVDQVFELAEAVGPRWALLVFLGAFATLRPEELAELRRRDIDLETLEVTVTLASPELTTGRRATGPTKSAAGVRTVVLPEFLAVPVRQHLAWWTGPEEDDHLFVGPRGGLFRRSTFGRLWRRARAAVGLPTGFRFYDLRHTGNTLLAEAGASLRDLMRRMGQSSVRAAMIYMHSTDKRQRELADKLDVRVRDETERLNPGPRPTDPRPPEPPADRGGDAVVHRLREA